MIALALTVALVLSSVEGDVRITGSSTVAPLVAEAVDEASIEDLLIAPNGTNRGFEQLCDEQSVMMIGASRRITDLELAACSGRGIRRLTELMIGLDGIVLAQSNHHRAFPVTLAELYLAAAFLVPENDGCVLVPNPNTTWRDVNPDLPNRPVKFFGPPTTSGTRNVFIDLALAEGARQIDCLAELERRDPAAFERAIMPRHDEAWLDAGENDEAIAAALLYARDGIGIFGLQSFNSVNGLRALPLNGVLPFPDTVASGAYPLSRPLYLYMTPEAMAEPSVRRLVTRVSPPSNERPVKVYDTRETKSYTVSSEN